MVPFGYVCLGLLVGILSGLSSSPVAGPLLAAIFTFAGGTAAHFLERKPSERTLIGTILATFAGGCLLGVLVGIVIKDNRLLTFPERRRELRALELRGLAPLESSYLKTEQFQAIRGIDVQYSAGDITAEEAYRQLRAQLERTSVQ